MAIKKKIMPMIFKSLACPNCGEKNSIRYIDEYNNVSTNLINRQLGTYQIRCLRCAKRYLMIWENDDYMLKDYNLSIYEFDKFYCNHKKRDIDEIAANEYKLPT